MLLDIQQGFYPEDEDLGTHTSENAHQQALKALMASNHSLFLSILTKHNMGRFKLSAFKVLAQSLNTKEHQIKEKYSKLLNQKFGQVLRASEIEGRFFVKPEQLSLHNYAKYQYFEDKSRLKADESIVQAYKNIFRRITNIDDFVYFIDFSVASVDRESFAAVEEKARQFLSEDIELVRDIQILKHMDNQGIQENMIIEYSFCVVSLNAAKKNESSNIEKITQKVQQALKKQPMKRLLSACLELSPANIIDDAIQKHPRELVQYDFKNNEVRLNSQYLHPQLCGYQTFKAYFKKMNYLEQLVQKFEIIAHSAKFQQGKLLLGINYDLLGDDEINYDTKYMYSKKVTTKCIAQFSEFLALIATHISQEFVVIGQKQIDKFYSVKYACKCLKLFANLTKLRSIRQHHIYQHILTVWGRMLIKWYQMEEIRQQEYFTRTIASYFSLLHSIDKHHTEFQQISNFQSEVSKVIYELLIKLEKYPCDLHSFKGMKTVIFEWGMQNLPITADLKSIINKFISCFFDDRLTIRSAIKYDIFQTPAISKPVKKMISAQISQAIAAKTLRFTNEKVNTSWHRNAEQYSNFCIKLGSIISSRILDSVQEFTSQLTKLYLYFAHVWPVLHKYRLWILQINKNVIDFKYEEKLQKVNQNWQTLYKKLISQATQNKVISWVDLSKQTLQSYQQFYTSANNLINSLFLKKNKDPFTKQICSRYFQFLLDITVKLQGFTNSDEKGESLIKQWTILGYSVEKGLKSIQTQLLFNLRYWICNPLRFLSISQQESIMSCIGQLMIRVSLNPNIYQPWTLICDILGVTDYKRNSVLSTLQMVGPLQRYTGKLIYKMQAFVPFNLISTLYASIRTNYKLILKHLFTQLLKEQNENLWLLIDKIVFSPVLISGSCIFNGQNQQKAKQDMALGIYYDQFQKITQLLTEGPEMVKNVRIIVNLEKKKIFTKFYQILRTKNVKIVEKAARPNPPSELRYRSRNMSNEEVINTLSQMGVSRDQAEIALQNIQYPDHNLAMEWIDNNQERLDDMILNRTLEKTRQEARREPRKQSEVPANQIAALSYQRFYDKDKIIKLSRSWIKIIFKQLFKEENMNSSQTLKELLFLFMDSLKAEQIQSQYTYLNDKIFIEIDELNKQKEISHKLLLYLTILQGSFSKTQKTKADFFQKSVNLKILSFLSRIQDPEIIQKIFSLINATLPVFTPNDIISPQLQNYLSFLLDSVLKYRSNKKAFSDIMLKIAKSGKKVLMQRITRNVTVFFKEKLIKENMFSLINILFESDKEFSRVNAQFDLKTHLYERYKHRLSNFHPDKEHVLEVDIKQFQSSFAKYEKGSAIYQVAIGMLSKKKNKNRLLFYDCRNQQNAFDYSSYGKSSFLKYPIRQNFRTIIKSMLASLFEAKDREVEEDVLTDLYKLLNNYRILIPFTIHQQILGTNLIEWLLLNNDSKRKFKFLTFLTLNANFFIPIKDYQFSSLSDYIISRIIVALLQSSSSNLLWTSFIALYLSQVKRFSELTEAKLSKEAQINLIQHYQKLLDKADALEYINISQFLYVQYKRRVVNNLRRRYKFAASQVESTFDRQFLNLSPFFNSVPLKKQKTPQIQIVMAGNMNQMDEEDQQDDLMLLHDEEQQGHRFLRRRQNLMNPEPQYEQLIVPLPQPAPKQNKDKEEEKSVEPEKELEPLVIKNWQYLQDITSRFEKYLCFEEEIDSEIQLKEAVLPQQNIFFANISNGFKINIEEPQLDLDLKVKKLYGFQNRIIEIYNIIAPKNSWEIKKKQAADMNVAEERMAFMSLGRRLIQSLQSQGDSSLAHNRQALLTLQRLMHGRPNRESQIPPARVLNINDIYQHLVEFTQPIVPVIQQQPQQVIYPQAPQQQVQEVNEPHKNQELIVIQPVINNITEDNNIQNANQVININGQVPNNHPEGPDIPHDFQYEEIVPVVMQQPPEDENVVGSIIIQQNQVINSPQINPQSGVIQPEQNLAQGVIQQQIGQIQIQQPQNASQIPEVPPIAQPPTRQRQILAMMGLPQSFLRDVGLDQEFFDSLPEDLQQEQLLQFMAQQGASVNQRNNNANNNPNQPNEGPVDQVSQNVAFLASLDMQTRAQVLLEATPQFLATLPPNIREEAQRYRHHQINRIIQEEQIEQQKNHAQKSKAPLVYPIVKKQQFSAISEEAAQSIFMGVFNIYPKFRLSALKILLQNKQNQDKVLSTIIALLKFFDSNEKQLKNAKLTKVELQAKKHNITKRSTCSNVEIKQIRNSILHIILEHMTIPLYKDEEFLTRKIGRQVYCEELAHYNKGEQEIDPLIQLLDFALSYYPQLATELLKKAKALPVKILQKLVDGIRRQVWPLSFYDSLQNFSQNEQLKNIFAKQFDIKPPATKILSKLLKYKFAQLISLKKIHQDALQYYTNNNIELLNQIFCIYNVQNIHQVEPLLVKYKQIHFEVIKYLIQNGKEIEKQPIGILLKRPHLLDFQTKKFIFRSHPRLRRSNGRRVHIEVDRAHLFQGSYNQLMGRSVRELQGKIQVSFINQPGYDAGGLKREWFLLVSRQIFNQDYALFEKSSSGSTYQPNPKSYINPDHLNYFKFIGRFIAKALVERELIDAYFTRAFYKTIIGQQLEFKDLQAQDYEFYKSMQWLKNNKIDEGIFTFSYIYDNFGNKIEKELIPGGKDIVVTQENKKDYIQKYSMAKMRDDFSTQLNKFLEGFHQVVPQEWISYFDAKELELLISGIPEVDVEDMKRNTDYSGYSPTDQIIVWFWEIVSQYTQEDIAKLVQFITGTSRIPVEGFSHLIGMNGIQRISIHKDPCEHQLPKSHTCFNQLDLPNYATKQILREKLAICLTWGSQGFGFM